MRLRFASLHALVRRALCLAAAVACMGVAAGPAAAQSWIDLATISSTLGNTAGRLCVGAGRTDLGCPALAPALDAATGNLTMGGLLSVPQINVNIVSATTGVFSGDLTVRGNFYVSGSQTIEGVTFANGGVSATGTVTATGFVGDGSGLTGVVASNVEWYNIAGIPAQVQAVSNGTAISLTSLSATTVSINGLGVNTVNAGTVSTTGQVSVAGLFSSRDVTVTGTVSAVNFAGSGASLTNIPASAVTGLNLDRITSGSSAVTVNSATGVVSLTQLGNASAYLHPVLGYVGPGVSASGAVSAATGYFGNNVGINIAAPSAALEISRASSLGNFGGLNLSNAIMVIREAGRNLYLDGNGIISDAPFNLGTSNARDLYIGTNNAERIRIDSLGRTGIGTQSPTTLLTVNGSLRVAAEASATMAVCDADRAGAIKYEGGDFSVCRNGTSWETLTGIAQGAAGLADRISSGTTQLVVASATGFVSLTQAGTNTGWFDPARGLVTLGVSATGPVSATAGYFSGNVGVGVTQPSTALHVGGTLRLANGAENCDANRAGALRYNGTVLDYCNGTVWATLASSNSSAGLNVSTGTSGSLVYRDQSGNLLASTSLLISSSTGSIGIGASPPSWVVNGLYATGNLATLATVHATAFNLNTSAMAGIVWNGGTNAAIRGDATNRYLAFLTSGTEAMRIVSTGNIGLGTSTPLNSLHIENAEAGLRLSSPAGRVLALKADDVAQNVFIGTISSHPLIFRTNNSARLTLDNTTGNARLAQSLFIGGGNGLPGNNYAASATLEVSGTLKISAGAEACDANRTGAMRYTGGDFQVCRNGTSWETLTGIAQGAAGLADRISSGTTQLVVTSATGFVSLTQAGTNTGWFDPQRGLVTLGVSATGPVSATNAYVSGKLNIATTTASSAALNVSGAAYIGSNGSPVADAYSSLVIGERPAHDGTVSVYLKPEGGDGFKFESNASSLWIWNVAAAAPSMVMNALNQVGIATMDPSTGLHVSGTLRLAAGTENCDADRTGAIKYEGGNFFVCRNGTSWETLVAGSSGTADTDRITSGTTSVIASQNASVTISTSGTSRVVIGATGNVGIGSTTMPETLLHVQGTGFAKIYETGAMGLYRPISNNATILGVTSDVSGTQSSVFRIAGDGTVGVNLRNTVFTNNSATLHVGGSIRLAAEVTPTLQTCDTNRTGAIKYEGGNFQICRNGTNWETLVAGSSGTADTDRVTSGTTSVIVNSATTYISLSTGGTGWGYLSSGTSYLPRLHAAHVSATTISTTGVQIYSPTTPLACNGTTAGTLRYNSPTTTLELCTGSGWQPMGVGVPAGTISAFASTTCPVGWSEYTPARGRFLRGIDNGAGNDPAGTRAPGNVQADMVGPHTHPFGDWSMTLNAGGTPGKYQISYADSNAGGGSFQVLSNGTAETRPKNVAVTYCQFNGTTNGWNNPIAGGSVTPGGNSGAVQYNSGGAFEGSDNFNWNNGAGLLTVAGTISTTSLTVAGKTLEQYIATNTNTDRITSGTTSVIANNNTGISFTTAGNQAMVITSSSRIGIATSSPAYALDVSGVAITRGGLITPALFGASNYLNIYPNGGPSAAAYTRFLYSADGSTWRESMRINAGDGNVGIATTTPTVTLEVSGTVSATVLQTAAATLPSTACDGAEDHGKFTLDPVTKQPRLCLPR